MRPKKPKSSVLKPGMPAPKECQLTPTSTPAAHDETCPLSSRKRQRSESPGANEHREQAISPDIDDAAVAKATETLARRSAYEKEGVHNLKEDVRRIGVQYSEFRTSYDLHVEATRVKETAVGGSMSRLEGEIKDRTTSADVQKLLDDEREARIAALQELTNEMPGTITGLVKSKLDDFEKPLKAVTERVDIIEAASTYVRGIVDNLKTTIERVPDAEVLKKDMIGRIQESLTKLENTMKSHLNTHIDTQVDQCASKLATIMIPQAVSPLDKKIDHVSDACTSTEKKVLALTAQQRKDKDDHSRRLKALEDKFNSTQRAHTERTDQLDKEIKALQENLLARDEEVLAERERTALLATEASRLETTMNELRNELDVERKKRKKSEAHNADIVRRLLDMEISAANARKDESTFEVKLKKAGADTAAKLLIQDRNFRAELAKQAEITTANVAEARKDLQSQLDQHKIEVTNHVDDIYNTNNIDHLRSRVETLEKTPPQGYAAYLTEAIGSKKELTTLKKSVESLSATTTKINTHVESIAPLSFEINQLQNQYRDHFENCKANIQDQIAAVATHTNNLETKLERLIKDENRVSQRHNFDTSDANRIFSALRTFEKQFDTLTSCVAEDMQTLEGKIQTFMLQSESELGEVVRQFQELEARQVSLSVRLHNLEALGCKVGGRRSTGALDVTRIRYEEVSG